MRMVINDGSGRRDLESLSYAQTRQAAAVMDCIGRLIPQEGVDYDVEIIFKGVNDPSVSMNVIPLTDKGEWWRKYVVEMINNKYPPQINNPEEALLPEEGASETNGQQEVKSEEGMS